MFPLTMVTDLDRAPPQSEIDSRPDRHSVPHPWNQASHNRKRRHEARFWNSPSRLVESKEQFYQQLRPLLSFVSHKISHCGLLTVRKWHEVSNLQVRILRFVND